MKTLFRTCLPSALPAVAALFLTGCDGARQTKTVADVTKPETILLTKRPGQGYIHSLHVEVSGVIEGETEILLIENGKPYRTEMLSGPVEFSWENDWYSDVAEIRHVPKTASGGHLRLSCRFED